MTSKAESRLAKRLVKKSPSARSSVIVLLLVAALLCWSYPGAASAQVESVSVAGGPPDFLLPDALEARTSAGEDDSLQLRLLELELERIQYEYDHSDIWHRLIPSARFSANFGWKNLIVYDPATLTSSTLPKDAYSVTIGLSLSGIFDGSKHVSALLGLKKAGIVRERLLLRMERSRISLEEELKKAAGEKDALFREGTIVRELLRFNDLRFRQGKIEYDAFIKSKLQLIELEKRARFIDAQLREIRLKLSRGGSP